MTNNDILRRIRYALDISNPKMVSMYARSGHHIEQSALIAMLKKEGDEGYIPCSSLQLGYFLDGLIADRRGERSSASPPAENPESEITNNSVLKKLRIALEIKEEEMISIMKLVSIDISKSELSALFRSRKHKNFKVCGDQFLRNFLKGLTIRSRNIYQHSD